MRAKSPARMDGATLTFNIISPQNILRQPPLFTAFRRFLSVLPLLPQCFWEPFFTSSSLRGLSFAETRAQKLFLTFLFFEVTRS